MDITLIIATYNRRDMLQLSLENLLGVDRDGLAVEIVVVDNNSSDGTSEMAQSYAGKLPLTCLRETRPGKNRALNKALDEIDLGEIVLFSDDDFAPPTDWLTKVWSGAQQHPEYDVFGGRVKLVWPKNAPKWARALEKVIYAEHDCGDEIRPYEKGEAPIGVNFWVRRSVFAEGRRYDESVGPIPNAKKRIMGSETSFLGKLAEDGYNILYLPSPCVGHYVTEDQTTFRYVRNRARTHGRFLARTRRPFPRAELYQANLTLWKASNRASRLRHKLGLGITYLQTEDAARAQKQVHHCRWWAYHDSLLNEHNSLWQRSVEGSA